MKNKLKIACVTLVLFASCTHVQHGKIVKDSDGNYYNLNGVDAIGHERYKLEPIDTSKFKPVGF